MPRSRKSTSPTLRLLSWNVNGLRAVWSRGFRDFIDSQQPDILCLQETKIAPDQAEALDWNGLPLERHWNSAEKRGYSGTALLTRTAPLRVWFGLDTLEDTEGRVINAEFEAFTLVNVYTPNAQRELTRLDYRARTWDPAFREHLSRLDHSKPVVFCGDLNVAHTEIDLANPKSNVRNAGFTPEERKGFSELLDAGFIDAFRQFEKGPGHYTWWTYRSNARARNIGWRIDYFGVSTRLAPNLRAASILPEVQGSDHCPVAIELARPE